MIKRKFEDFTLKACASIAAATDGEVFDRLVVFLKQMFRCIRTAKLGALWPITETGTMGEGRSASHFCSLMVLCHQPIEIRV